MALRSNHSTFKHLPSSTSSFILSTGYIILGWLLVVLCADLGWEIKSRIKAHIFISLLEKQI